MLKAPPIIFNKSAREEFIREKMAHPTYTSKQITRLIQERYSRL